MSRRDLFRHESLCFVSVEGANSWRILGGLGSRFVDSAHLAESGTGRMCNVTFSGHIRMNNVRNVIQIKCL